MAVSRAFAETGASLVLADTNMRKLEALVAELRTTSCTAIPLDVTSAADWQRVKSAPEVRVRDLDVAVMAAGIEGPIGFLEDVQEADFQRIMDVNVKGVWLGLKILLPSMKKRGKGAIVVLASLTGRMGAPLLAGYSASKHAVVGLVRSAAREAAPYGVRINAIAPGPVKSAMMNRIDARLLETDPDRFAGRNTPEASIPIRRYVTPEEVAELAVFLSTHGSGCTGGVFPVDGGVATW